jgi:PKD repeat protein
MSGPRPRPGRITARVEIGRYVLELGNPAGAAIAENPKGEKQSDTGSLSKALARSAKEHTPPSSKPSEPFKSNIDVKDKLKHALDLFNGLATGDLDAGTVSDEVDDLLGFLQRLDRDEDWREALSVARSLSMLLALLVRWMDLLRSLRLALSVAERLGDDDARAWALHELGTLHVLAGKHADADRLLGAAHDIRERTGDRPGQAATDRNLQTLCKTLRAELPKGWIARHARILASLLALSLLLVGGVAGAAIHGSDRVTPSISIAVSPGSPGVDERVAFHVISNSTADPYIWWFGDGRSSVAARPRHRYRQPGRYRVMVAVIDGSGAIVGSASQLVLVSRQPPPPTTKTTSTKLSTKPALLPSEITAACPSDPVILGAAVKVAGAVTPPPTPGATVTVSYTTPSGTAQSQTLPTGAEGEYTSFTSAAEPGQWSVSVSWPGDTSYAPATSEGCSFEVLSREEAYTRSVK